MKNSLRIALQVSPEQAQRLTDLQKAFAGVCNALAVAYPELSAVQLLAEIRAAGYTGVYSQLTEFVRQVRSAPAPEPVVRFETRQASRRRWT